MEVKIVRGATAELVRENNVLKRHNAELEATLEYVAMMTDVDLPEGESESEEGEGVE